MFRNRIVREISEHRRSISVSEMCRKDQHRSTTKRDFFSSFFLVKSPILDAEMGHLLQPPK